MRIPFRLAAIASGVLALPAQAAELNLSLQIPQLDVAEYHRPYVAAWIEREDRSVAAQLAVWYQQKRASNNAAPAAGAPPSGAGAPMGQNAQGGTKWLPDLRQWWRRGGRELDVPADGITGATRAVGEHQLSFRQGQAPLGDLAPGQYKLIVEAAREEGGRELLEIPFEWPAKASGELKAQGKTELGAVRLTLKP